MSEFEEPAEPDVRPDPGADAGDAAARGGAVEAAGGEAAGVENVVVDAAVAEVAEVDAAGVDAVVAEDAGVDAAVVENAIAEAAAEADGTGSPIGSPIASPVGAAMRELDALADRDLAEHPDVYQRIHTELQAALTTIDDA